MRLRGRRRRAALVAGDLATWIGVYVAVVLLRRVAALPGTSGELPPDRAPLELWPWLLALGLAALAALHLLGAYDETAEAVRERGGLLVAAIVGEALYFGFHFLVAGLAVPRTVVLLHLPLAWLSWELWRAVAERLVPVGVRGVVVLGSGEDARRAADALSSGSIPGYRLLAARTDADAVLEGAPELLDEALDVVFAPGGALERAALVGLLERSVRHEFDLWLVPGLADVVGSRIVTRTLGDLPLAPVRARGASPSAFAVRRVEDVLLGGVLLLLALPVLLVASVAVVLDSPGPAWIRQSRVGLRGKVFGLLKVRTMRRDAEDATGPVLASPNDPRLTRIGGFLRRTRIDELPQLVHVLTGEMSLIGPRPERPELVEAYERELPVFRLRKLLKPGITGLAQVMGSYATRPDLKLRHDLGYLLHWNPALDLFLLVRTVATVLRLKGI